MASRPLLATFLLTSREAGRILFSTSRGVSVSPSAVPRSPGPSLMPLRHPPESDALRGSIDLLVLKALSLAPMHGWGIGLRIQQISRGRLEVNQGSLYPALQRLEHRGDIESAWQSTENNRRARLFGDFVSDVRYALRAMRRSPGFAVAVAVTLGIGIGINGIVFGFVNTLLFRPIPARHADELVGVFTIDTKTGRAGLLAYQD